MEGLHSDILFTRPSFFRGFCRTFDLFGQFDLYNISASPYEADRIALSSDLYMLGIDSCRALDVINEEFEQEVEKNDSLALK